MATNLPSSFFIQFLEQLLRFLVNFTLLKYVKSQRSYGFLITKELIFGFQILDLKDHFSASLTLNRPGGGGGIRQQAGSSLCCAETVSSRKLKLSDFYYILIGLNSEYKPVPWDIHCCHGNAIVEWCSVKFWLKSVENCIFLLKSFSNLSLGLLFVISISKLPPVPNFKQIGLKAKKLGFSTFF